MRKILGSQNGKRNLYSEAKNGSLGAAEALVLQIQGLELECGLLREKNLQLREANMLLEEELTRLHQGIKKELLGESD